MILSWSEKRREGPCRVGGRMRLGGAVGRVLIGGEGDEDGGVDGRLLAPQVGELHQGQVPAVAPHNRRKHLAQSISLVRETDDEESEEGGGTFPW